MAHITDAQTDPNASSAPEPVTRLRQDSQAACCGGAAPTNVEACCALDASVKSAGGSGCDCTSQPVAGKNACC